MKILIIAALVMWMPIGCKKASTPDIATATPTAGDASSTPAVPMSAAALNNKNVLAIRNGLAVADVEAILGTGETVTNGSVNAGIFTLPIEHRVWKVDAREVDVDFANGKAMQANSSGF